MLALAFIAKLWEPRFLMLPQGSRGDNGWSTMGSCYLLHKWASASCRFMMLGQRHDLDKVRVSKYWNCCPGPHHLFLKKKWGTYLQYIPSLTLGGGCIRWFQNGNCQGIVKIIIFLWSLSLWRIGFRALDVHILILRLPARPLIYPSSFWKLL